MSHYHSINNIRLENLDLSAIVLKTLEKFHVIPTDKTNTFYDANNNETIRLFCDQIFDLPKN